MTATVDVLIEAFAELGLDFQEAPQPAGRARVLVVELPGTHKLKTPVAFTVAEHSVSINAFVVRSPDEHTDRVHRWLLRRNQRLFAVAYAVDHLGDVYLVARLPAEAITMRTVDEILGSIAATADGDFDILLEMGFESAIRAEWKWRLARGEPTYNLEAFRHLAPGSGHGGAAGGEGQAAAVVAAPDATPSPDAAGFGHDR